MSEKLCLMCERYVPAEDMFPITMNVCERCLRRMIEVGEGEKVRPIILSKEYKGIDCMVCGRHSSFIMTNMYRVNLYICSKCHARLGKRQKQRKKAMVYDNKKLKRVGKKFGINLG